MLAAVIFVLSSIPASAQEYYAKFSGFQETGSLPGPTAAESGAILSTATGTLKLTVDKAGGTITYSLTYTFPANTTTGTTAGATTTAATEVLQSHIHFGKEHVPGGIMVFLCTTTGITAPAGIQTCAPSNGAPVTVTGIITAADVTAKAAAQGVFAMNFDGVVAALESDTAYANIHTSAYTSGEIRGQIHRVRDHHRDPRGNGPNGNNGDHDNH
jgi:hypothetical protein